MRIPRSPCKKCGKRYKVLTKEGTCMYCFKKEHGVWSPEFGSGKQVEMKFGKKEKTRKKKFKGVKAG